LIKLYCQKLKRHKRREVTKNWRKLHNEELCNLCTSLNFVREIEPKRMNRMWYVPYMGEMRSEQRILVVKYGDKNWLGRPRLGRKILKQILQE
jgi:hypothetical protein